MATPSTLGYGVIGLQAASTPASGAATGKIPHVRLVDADNAALTLPTTATAAASEAHIGQVGGTTLKPQGTVTRTNDTNAYAAGDVWANATSGAVVAEIDNCARINAGSGTLLNGMLVDSAAVATAGSFEAWIFSATFTQDQDNAVFTPTDAELLTLVAIIPFTVSYIGDATVGAGGNRVYLSDPIQRGFVCGASSKKLYWCPVVRNAYVPVASETLSLILTILSD